MSRRGNCWDNAVVESFFATLKVELVHDVGHAGPGAHRAVRLSRALLQWAATPFSAWLSQPPSVRASARTRRIGNCLPNRGKSTSSLSGRRGLCLASRDPVRNCPLGYAELGTTRPAWGVAGTPASRNPGAHMKGSSLPSEPWRDGARLRPTGAVRSESCRSQYRTTAELTPMSRPDVAKIGPPLPPMVAHVAVRKDTPPFERADGPTFCGVARNPRSRKR